MIRGEGGGDDGRCSRSFSALIEQRADEPILRVDQEISAESMSPLLATLCGLPGAEPPGSVLRLLRRYASAKGTLVASYNWHPAESFTYRMQVQLQEPTGS